MIDLRNKRILLIAPRFYNYHTEIINSLTSLGADVKYFPEMNHSLLFRVLRKFSRKVKALFEYLHIRKIITHCEVNTYDSVFVIRGGTFTPNTLQELKSKLPKASFIMYQWDSVLQNNYIENMRYFDKVWTFDSLDAKTYNISYYPLFFTSNYKNIEKKEKIYDLVFYGAYHSDRLEVIKSLTQWCADQGLCFKSHLYISKLAFLRFFMTRKLSIDDLKFLKTYSVPTSDVIQAYSKTVAVLDIELDIQSGLTMRTFEVLGAGLKLITTNANIKKEHFYDRENILLLDRKNMELSPEFFRNTKNKALDMHEYYIDHWLKKILTIEV